MKCLPSDCKLLAVLWALLALLPVSCDGDVDFLDEDAQAPAAPVERALACRAIELSPHGDTIMISADLIRNLGYVQLDDSQSVGITAREFFNDTVPCPEKSQPVFSHIVNEMAHLIRENNLRMNVIVDLTINQAAVDLQKKAVRQLRAIFPSDYLTLSFMDNEGLKEPVPSSDYVLDNYFKSTGGTKYLLREILARLDSIEVEADSLEPCALKRGNRLLVVFSDGKVYSNSIKPIDPRHFINQNALTVKSSALDSLCDVYYVNFATGESNEAGDLMRKICENSGGLYLEEFDWQQMEKHVFGRLNVDHVDYKIYLKNPSGKVYRGVRRTLLVEFWDGAESIASLQTEYAAGSFARPVIVDGASMGEILTRGVAISLILALLAYLVMQLLVPKIRAVIFNRKWVTSYKRNLSVHGILVDKECYYCKAPFADGDRIVAKCKHSMHKECWDENGYHCPEHGRNCRKGSHYYNPHNLLDPWNAMHQMKWILLAIIAGMSSWITMSTVNDTFSSELIRNTILRLYKIDKAAPEAGEFVMDTLNNHSQLPSFGLYLGFMLTFLLSIMSLHRRARLINFAEALGRATVGGIVGYCCFFIGCIAGLVLKLDSPYILNWIPWSVTGFLIAFISTFRTRIRLKKMWLLIAICVGIASTLIWGVIFTGLSIDYRVPLLTNHIIFAIGIALSIAQTAPMSERYYFHVGGAMKEMDIAIYKWFSANSNRIVTIGRSVDCDLIMSWDMTGDVAPVQANISKKNGRLYITPLEEGVYMKGRSLPVGKARHLYHGNRFTIGKTEFIYQEKDI